MLYVHLIVESRKHGESYAVLINDMPTLTEQEARDLSGFEEEENESYGRGVRLIGSQPYSPNDPNEAGKPILFFD